MTNFLHIIHVLILINKNDIPATGIHLCPWVKATLLGPMGRASPYLRKTVVVQVMVQKLSKAINNHEK
jgi:hypothetical protein